MFGIGFGELLFIILLIVIFVGPERLPKVMRQMGIYAAQIRKLTRELNHEFSEELKPLYEMQNLAKELNPGNQIRNLIPTIDLDETVSRTPPRRAAPPPDDEMTIPPEGERESEPPDETANTIAPPMETEG